MLKRCSNCSTKQIKLEVCKSCGREVCKLCVIGGLCNDCVIDVNIVNEYFKDKYDNEIFTGVRS